MLVTKGFSVVVALAPIASAFFPWVPEYRCIEEKTCISSKRALEARDAHVMELPSFKIVQRTPQQDHIPHELHISRLAERLTKKYSKQATKVRAEGLKERDGVVKRTNTYSISTASAPSQSNSAGIDQDGTDYSYFAQIYLGSAKTPMYMLLDTGAGTSWVMGPSCTSASCQLHNSFGAADSKTFKALTTTFSVTYGSGSVSGTLATDSLTFAGLTFNATFGIADITSADFTSFPMDGILGLSQAAGETPTFLSILIASKALKSNIFGIDINRAADGPNNGEINFGAPDTSRFSGSLGYNAVASSANGDWAISMDNVGFDGNLAGITGRLAYIDTGTSYVFAPTDDVATFHKLISGSVTSDNVTYSVPCTTTTTMEFVFGGVSYSVLAKDWVGGAVGGGQCTSNIYGHEVVPGAWLLGDTFLKNVYTVFDVDEDRIGFAAKNSSTGTSSTVSSISTSTNSAASTTGTSVPSPSTTVSPGVTGHKTSAASGTQASETSAASGSSTASATSTTSKANTIRLDTSLFTTFLNVVVLLTLTL